MTPPFSNAPVGILTTAQSQSAVPADPRMLTTRPPLSPLLARLPSAATPKNSPLFASSGYRTPRLIRSSRMHFSAVPVRGDTGETFNLAFLISTLRSHNCE